MGRPRRKTWVNDTTVGPFQSAENWNDLEEDLVPLYASRPVDTIAALRAIDTTSATAYPTGTIRRVLGYHAAGDGGGGLFRLNRSSTTADNGGTVIAPTTGGGRWERIYEGAISVKWFGARGDGTDDGAFLRAAYASGHKYVVWPRPSTHYAFTGFIDIPDGVVSVARGGRVKVVRNDNVIGWRCSGVPQAQWVGGVNGHNRRVQFWGFNFEGNNQAAYQMQFVACNMLLFFDCEWNGSGGGDIDFLEVQDSTFIRPAFDYSGSVDATVPVVRLSGEGIQIPGAAAGVNYDVCNQVHFIAPRWESYRGPILGTNGANVNEVHVVAGKAESSFANGRHLDLAGAVNVNAEIQFTSKGASGATIPEVVNLANCRVFQGRFRYEHLSGGAAVTRFGAHTNSSQLDVKIDTYNNGHSVTAASLWVGDGVNEHSMNIRGTTSAGTKPVYNGGRSVTAKELAGPFSTSATASAKIGTLTARITTYGERVLVAFKVLVQKTGANANAGIGVYRNGQNIGTVFIIPAADTSFNYKMGSVVDAPPAGVHDYEFYWNVENTLDSLSTVVSNDARFERYISVVPVA